MKILMLHDRKIYGEFTLEKDKTYEVIDIVGDTYKVALPMKRVGKFKYALVEESEGVLID